MFGYWLDTVNRQRGDTETFGHWLDTADRQRGGSMTFGHWSGQIH